MKATLINLPIVGQLGNYLSGLPHQPVGLLSVAASLRRAGAEVDVVDCFAEAPGAYREIDGGLALRGLWGRALLERVRADSDLVGVSLNSCLHHRAATALARDLKGHLGLPVVAGGEHATIAAGELVTAGFDFVLRGEGELTAPRLLESLGNGAALRRIPGLLGTGLAGPDFELIEDLDGLAWPAFDLVSLESYWRRGDAHGPFAGPYLDLFTSRGCPNSCRFCSGPASCRRRWRGRSPENVVAEIEYAVATFGVGDFHIQDPNFSADPKRMRRIADLVVERGLDVSLCLPTGIHVEHMEDDDLEALARAGLRYVSVAPESGSERVRQLMNKRVDVHKLRAFVERARALGIRTSASFIAGYPGEDDGDRRETRELALDLVRRGLDEFTVFIFCPVPGSAAASLMELPGYEALGSMPAWRSDYPELAAFRRRLLAEGLLAKAVSHPGDLFAHARHVLSGRFQTKGEMVLRRVVRSRLSSLARRARGLAAGALRRIG